MPDTVDAIWTHSMLSLRWLSGRRKLGSTPIALISWRRKVAAELGGWQTRPCGIRLEEQLDASKRPIERLSITNYAAQNWLHAFQLPRRRVRSDQGSAGIINFEWCDSDFDLFDWQCFGSVAGGLLINTAAAVYRANRRLRRSPGTRLNATYS